MFPSAAIDIPYSTSDSPLDASLSSPMSSGLYIPVHKRTSSSSSAASNSSRSASPALSTGSDSSERNGVYAASDLLLLASSPLARLPLETLSSLRQHVPDIMMNRRQRKDVQFQSIAANPLLSPSSSRTVAGRRRPAGRGSERRRGAAAKVVDELNWRGAVAVLSRA